VGGGRAPAAIPGLLAGLARRLGVPEQADQAELLASLWDELRQRDRWLLVYDNAQGPRELAPYRPPDGAGRVLVTSRAPTWGRGTAALRLDVLKREEAVAFLRRRTGSADTESLTALTEALGDLPLALEQAAAYMDETRTTPAGYLALFQEHGAELLARGEPLTTEQTVATTWQVALDQLRAAPGAPDLLSLCAFLAPDDIPRAILGKHAEKLPEPLSTTVGRPLASALETNGSGPVRRFGSSTPRSRATAMRWRSGQPVPCCCRTRSPRSATPRHSRPSRTERRNCSTRQPITCGPAVNIGRSSRCRSSH
jgi:hypothetical protein